MSPKHTRGLTDAEFASILEDGTKRIREDIEWREDQDHSPVCKFRADVESSGGWPLFVEGRCNAVSGTLNYAVILNTAGRIYALDLGKAHKNPEGEVVGEKHKHRWSERCGDREAYVPDDVDAPASDPVAVWKQGSSGIRVGGGSWG